MNIFKKSGKAVTTAVDAVTDTVDELTTVDSPLLHLPNVTGEHAAALGDDFNIVLLVKEHGARRQHMLIRQRNQLLKELDAVDKELAQIDVLLKAAETL